MNAYELADGGDIIAEKNSTLDNQVRGYISDMADMLRQQADRIAELEKGGEVAGRFYWESVVDGHVMAVPSEGTPHYNKDDFPLYTASQTKPLSDEEIQEIADETDISSATNPQWIFIFARAILKKASEK